MSLLDLIFPARCLICFRYGDYLCPSCSRKLQVTLPQCFICRRVSNNYRTHYSCKKQSLHTQKERPNNNINEFTPSRVTVLWEYGDIGRALLTEAKYNCSYHIYSNISAAVRDRLTPAKIYTKWAKSCFFQPIPQHRQRSIFRGFDHTMLLTELFINAISQMGDRSSIKRCSILEKRLNNKRQASLSKEGRHKNVQGAYAVNHDWITQIPSNSTIVLVDDVMTTGSTITEATKTLKSVRPDLNIEALVLFRGRARFQKLPTENPTGQIISRR